MNSRRKYKVLVFGNALLKNDSIQIRLLPELRAEFPCIEFKECDPNDNLENEGKELNILDCAKGISKVVLLNDIDNIETQKIYGMHDFDLGYSLKLMKKLGYLDKLNLFCVPTNMHRSTALKQLKALISATLC